MTNDFEISISIVIGDSDYYELDILEILKVEVSPISYAPPMPTEHIVSFVTQSLCEYREMFDNKAFSLVDIIDQVALALHDRINTFFESKGVTFGPVSYSDIEDLDPQNPYTKMLIEFYTETLSL